MRRIAVATLLLAFGLTNALAADKPLTEGKAIFIDKFPQEDLDTYLKAELVKKKIKLRIVGTPEEADYILTGTNTPEQRRAWHQGWLTSEQDRTTAAVEVIDAKTKEFLWASEAGDRNIWWGVLARGGQRKVADRLANNIKRALGKSPK